ncbi:MAG: YciI family protein [Gammaproteobacteria bacterium]|nr:YciI family protein [Gammaproteobacteria bacterium]
MNYLCLVYGEEALIADVDDRECQSCRTAFENSGHLRASARLQPVHAATTVRVRGDRISIMDGPFAETKEQLAGFYLLEARDLDEALALAARIPPARIGSVEVRPVMRTT